MYINGLSTNQTYYMGIRNLYIVILTGVIMVRLKIWDDLATATATTTAGPGNHNTLPTKQQQVHSKEKQYWTVYFMDYHNAVRLMQRGRKFYY